MKKEMTFGTLKSAIEKNLLESYRNSNEFRKSMREFKENILNHKSISKIYSLYDQLSSPQGLSESESEEFLAEGIELIKKLISEVKLPKTILEIKTNTYSDIDTLVYTNKTNLHERLQSKKNIVKTLCSEKNKIEESIKLPTKTMVKIANQTLETYIESMDEKSKKTFFEIIKKENNKLEEEFETLKESTLEKLEHLLNSEKENDLKIKISETIERVRLEECNQINYVKLLSLTETL